MRPPGPQLSRPALTSACPACLQGTYRDEYGRLRLGDVIVGLNGQPVKSERDLFDVLDGCKVRYILKFSPNLLCCTRFKGRFKVFVPVKLEQDLFGIPDGCKAGLVWFLFRDSLLMAFCGTQTILSSPASRPRRNAAFSASGRSVPNVHFSGIPASLAPCLTLLLCAVDPRHLHGSA